MKPVLEIDLRVNTINDFNHISNTYFMDEIFAANDRIGMFIDFFDNHLIPFPNSDINFSCSAFFSVFV